MLAWACIPDIPFCLGLPTCPHYLALACAGIASPPEPGSPPGPDCPPGLARLLEPYLSSCPPPSPQVGWGALRCFLTNPVTNHSNKGADDKSGARQTIYARFGLPVRVTTQRSAGASEKLAANQAAAQADPTAVRPKGQGTSADGGEIQNPTAKPARLA